MTTFQLAHINEQGQDMFLFPMDARFGHRAAADQSDILSELQSRARSAGLSGVAAAVWRDATGRTHTLGPRLWDGFLRSIDLDFVLANVNREISW